MADSTSQQLGWILQNQKGQLRTLSDNSSRFHFFHTVAFMHYCHVLLRSSLHSHVVIACSTQAGYGRFNITTVWLDAAEPERPTEDTVGQFLFSKGEESSVRNIPMQARWIKKLMMMTELATLKNC